MNKKSVFSQFFGVILLSLAVFLAFLQRPGLGDDFTYWKIGFEVSEGMPDGWRADNFHDLRWPVWGLSWLIDKLGGAGLVSYYLPPFLYLAAGSLIAFFLTCRILNSDKLGWTATLAFLFQPLIDSIIYRPMPDLSEGIWGTAAVLAWFGTMEAERRGKIIGLGMLTGLFLAVAHSNRFTGLLLIPVLLVLTLIFYREKWGRFLVILFAAFAAIGIECLIYKQITGDFFHSIHSNLSARGKKGTEAINPLILPFRFLDTLWEMNHLSPFYFLLSLIGGWAIWRKGKILGRAVVATFLVWYLGYSCALQKLWPPHPMLRDADRFLSALAIPMAVLIAAGCGWLWVTLRARPELRLQNITGWLDQHRIVGVVIGLALLCTITSRSWFNLDYLPEFRHYLGTRPTGTKVLTHGSMWDFAHLINIDAARRLNWREKSNFLDLNGEMEQWAEDSDEIWFSRKLVWLRSRKDQLYKGKDAQPPMATFLAQPEKKWLFAELIPESNKPEFVFYQKRPVGTYPAILTAADIGLALPLEFDGDKRLITKTFSIPDPLRGKRVRIRTEAEADTVQAIAIYATFLAGDQPLGEVEIKPNFYPSNAIDFFNVEIPESATACKVRMEVGKRVKDLKLNLLQMVAD